MTEQTRGKIAARGTQAEVALTMQALDECVNVSGFEDKLARPFVTEYHTKAEFKAAGYVLKVPGGTIVAEGFVVAPGLLWIRKDIAANRPKRAKHLNRHEWCHCLALTAAKRVQLMDLMVDANGKHPTQWRSGAYVSKPYECYADSMAEAISGIDSPFDDFAFYRLDVLDADLPQFLTITFAQTQAPATDEPTTDPLPPMDPQMLALEARLAAKDTKLKEALAI